MTCWTKTLPYRSVLLPFLPSFLPPHRSIWKRAGSLKSGESMGRTSISSLRIFSCRREGGREGREGGRGGQRN